MKIEEKQKAIDALKISAPIKALTQEEFNDYIQTLNKVMDWLEQEPTTKNDLRVECISRSEAIKCLECDFDITGKENMKTVVNYINSVHNKIVNLPRVEQDPKKGQWDKDGACPFCGYFQQWNDDNYCGHCGAKLNEVNQDFNQDVNQE